MVDGPSAGFKDALRRGQRLLGAFVVELGSARVAAAFGQAGWDFLVLDTDTPRFPSRPSRPWWMAAEQPVSPPSSGPAIIRQR
jgi:2-keto-3-deoxy-L-rhamnonate aldolase RhmA